MSSAKERFFMSFFLRTICIALFLCTCCCKNSSSSSLSNWQIISGRNDSLSLQRNPVYRALVPLNWIRKDPPLNESITDTTKPICEFFIEENNQTIRLTIHSFPITENISRIPPQAQISRWKKQFTELDPLNYQIQGESHGGFAGLFFEGEGFIKEAKIKMMAWSMCLAECYNRQLSQEITINNPKRADYTLKATGPPEIMNKYRSDLIAFSQSFELIDELPPP